MMEMVLARMERHGGEQRGRGARGLAGVDGATGHCLL